jgi:ABC-type multidrug transport system permease subunit
MSGSSGMRFLWNSALKDVKRQLHDPLAISIWLGIPVIVALLVFLAFGRTDTPPRAQLLITDLDKSTASQFLQSALARAPVMDVETVSLEEGRRRIEAGKGSAFLVLPQGFGDAVLQEKPLTLRLVTNPEQRILPGIVEETISILVDGTFYVQRVIGEPLREISIAPPRGRNVLPDSLVASFSVRMNQLGDRLSGILFPPVIKLETHVEANEQASSIGMGQLFFPSIVFMSLLFVAQGLSSDIWQEVTLGTLRRIRTTPQRITTFLGGKLVGATLFVAGVVLGALAIGAVFFDLALARIPLALAWITFVGTVFIAVLMWVQMFASSQRTANISTTLVILPLLMVGGSFFPFEAMPAWLARIGKRTPNGWALEQLKAILWGQVEPGSLALAFVALAAVGLLAFLLGARRIDRGFGGN